MSQENLIVGYLGGNEPFKDLPTLASRLGVEPVDGSSNVAVLLRMNDGRSYSLFEIINAFLDRIDNATREPSKT